MIDIKLIRSDPDKYIKAARDKNISADIPALLQADSELLGLNQQLQDARTEQNAAGKQIAELIGQGKVDAIMAVRSLKTTIAELEEKIEQIEPKFDELMLLVAQPAADDVPTGIDDTENVTPHPRATDARSRGIKFPISNARPTRAIGTWVGSPGL